ncbi:DUF1343 domain-containing protein, partial [bacterium]|nr:DUF1343 domain-containing protein [bacterium]
MKTGLEVFLEKSHKNYRGMRLGVLCNQASVDAKMRHISELVLQKKLGLNIGCFIGPQHGIRGEKQDNMVESQDFTDPKTGKVVYSLYGDTREPTDAMLANFDAFLIDLQDVGTRIYTFIYTIANCMRAAKRTGKKVILLDRPNPIDGITLEGNFLEPEFTSFVGQYPIIVRHGMTMGELALLINEHFGVGCDLEIVRLQGWKRSMHADQWKRDWVPPSPNIPRYQSALVFPAGVYFEGTNISEGRGTTMPFEYAGAPYIDPDVLAADLNGQKLPGIYFRPIFFQPTYQKWKDSVCGGVHFHVTDRKKFNGFQAGIRLIEAVAKRYAHSFDWKMPPYE